MSLRAAIGETVFFSLFISAPDQPVSQPSIQSTPLTSGTNMLPPAAIRLYRLHDVISPPLPGWHIRNISPSDRLGSIPDVLIPVNAPFGGMPEEFAPGATYRFLAEIRIPKGTFHDRYEGGIELRQRNVVVATLPVTVEVLPFQLPRPPWSVIAEVDHRELIAHHVREGDRPLQLIVDEWTDHPKRDDIDMQVRIAMQTLARHGLTPVLPRLAPPARIEPTGRMRIDWTTYDRLAEPCLNGSWFADGKPPIAWAAPVNWTWFRDDRNTTGPSRIHACPIDAYLGNVADHFSGRGWLDKSYFDVDRIAEGYETNARVAFVAAELAKQRSPGIRLLTRHQRVPATPVGNDDRAAWAGAKNDILAPFAGDLPASNVDPRGEEVGRRWVTLDRPPFSSSLHVASPSSHLLSLGWQLDAMRVEAALLGSVNNWPDTTSNPSPHQCLSRDPTNLLYPGAGFGLTEPVASFRLKLIERTLEDAAYAELLRQKGLEHVVDALRSSLVAYVGWDARRSGRGDGRPIGWVEDEQAYHTARDIMIDALLDSIRPGQGSTERSDFTRSATWRRFMSETRRVQLSTDGCRARGSTSTGWEVSCTASITNRARVPVRGTLSLQDMPSGWTPALSALPVVEIAPGASRRETLTATCDQFVPATNGVAEARVRFAPDDHDPAQTTARLALAVAAPSLVVPLIDGNLSDWPVSEGNTAGDFQLITSDETVGLPHAQGRGIAALPALRTHAFARRSSEFLLFGIVSQTSGRDANSSRSNVVRCDDGIPTGDELVEILLDPTNAGTRDPLDLFRVSIKSSGAYAIARGVDNGDENSSPKPWAADVRIAVQHGPGRWTVEVAIPLSAFGESAQDDTVWGWNITRFDAEHQEFSTWSGARGNAYDPLSLGNLLVPTVGK